MNDDPATELHRLATIIAHHDHAYHTRDAPEISDGEYDALRERYRALAAKHPDAVPAKDPERRVGGPTAKSMDRIAHTRPMLSLENTFDDAGVVALLTRAKAEIDIHARLLAEPKLDGLSCSLRYENGRLVRALTRGDGRVGEDVTRNASMCRGVPHTINNAPRVLEVRGEICMDRADLETASADRVARGGAPFATTRNAAAGTLRAHDADAIRRRPLRFIAYALGETSERPSNTASELREHFRSWGFAVVEPAAVVATPDDIAAHRERIEAARPNLPQDIDGIVYKLDDFTTRDRMGDGARAPRWAVARKFPAVRAQTRLQRIDVQIGRTGAVTPVAILDPTTIDGVTITRASLHNFDDIARRDIRPGDTVKLERAGDVIPRVLHPVDPSPPETRAPLPTEPETCPCHLQTPVRRVDGAAVARCGGELACPYQCIERIKHFVSRDAFDIRGLGDTAVRKLHDNGLLGNPADVFRLPEHVDTLAALPGLGETSARAIAEAVRARLHPSLAVFIHALGIPLVGREGAKALAGAFDGIDDLRRTALAARDDASARNRLMNIDGIGPATAYAIAAVFAEPANTRVVDDLATLGVQPTNVDGPSEADASLAGITVVFTGTIPEGRANAAARAESAGAKVSESVSGKTTHVVAGEGAGSKLAKAKRLGVTILSPEQWEDLMARR